MPKIAELKEIDGQLWARIPSSLLGQDESITLWMESEKKFALDAERKRCIQALLNLKT